MAKYGYDGRGFRIVKKTYTSGTLSETRDFYFTSNWQSIEERVGGSMVDQHVWGVRFIDELVCRDDATPQRLYAMQDANFNLTCISDASGIVVERYVFDPYAKRAILSSSWGLIYTSSYGWVVGFQGLNYDNFSNAIYARNRYLHQLGLWLSRDPLKSSMERNLYQYINSNPLKYVDPIGLQAGPTKQPTTRPSLIPPQHVPAEDDPKCGVTLNQRKEIGGHEWIGIDLGVPGQLPLGAGFWPSGWQTWEPARKTQSVIGTEQGEYSKAGDPQTGWGDPYAGSTHLTRSRAHQTLTYAVNVSTGDVGNALIGNTWYDPSGNVLQSIGEGAGKVFTKQTYNGVGWVMSSYRGYNTSGVSYSQATTVSGDIIVEQKDNTYDEAGNIVGSAMSQRLNDAPASGTGSTGALSYSSDPKARVSYTASWFDGVDRGIASANYGAIASFTRPSTPPSSSASVLVTSTAYDDASRPYQATDPMGVLNQTGFDNANRTTQTTEDLGGLARTTNFTYTLDNLIRTMTAVNSSTGDQTTTWVYGTTLANSGVARNDLLRATIYPNTDLSWATLTADQWTSLTAAQWASLRAYPVDTTFANYNRLGEQTTFTDQRRAVRTFTRNALGRQTDDGVTTVGANTDSAVLRISRAYEIRGLVSMITSADNATPGAGTILNQFKLTYNDFSQLSKDDQEHSGAVGSSTPSVQYGYDSGASSSNQVRLNRLTYPNARQITYSFGTSGGMSDYLGRVEDIIDTTSGSTTLAQYLYVGAGKVIRITYPEPGVWLDLWGGTSGTFAGIDLFGRIIDQRWQNNIASTPGDIDRYKYGYDQNSNRLWKANVVGTAAMTAGLDEFYVYDPLNRLTEMQRGVLNGTQTGITGTPSIEQDWTLDPTGNWANFTTKASGTTDLDQTRTANTVNEITNITESTGPTWVVPAYDAAGNTITMPQPASPTNSFAAAYDAWNRMVSINDSANPVGKYQYDGRNFRIVKKTYTSGVLSETRDFYFTSNWQDIEEQVGGSMVDQYVWGIRYIDELVCRDDATPQRLYGTQDANFNLTTVTDSTGTVIERYLFDPYGVRTVMNASWSISGFSSHAWRIGFQGWYEDAESALQNDRNRVLSALIGSWLQRDDRYRQNASLYSLEGNSPIGRRDPTGRDYYSDSGFAGQISRDEFNELRAIIEKQTGEAHGYGSGVDTVSALYATQALGWDVSKLSAAQIFKFFREELSVQAAMNNAWNKSLANDPAILCYLNCKKKSLAGAAGVGGLGGALPNLPYFPKVLSYPFLDPGSYADYLKGGPIGTLRTAVAAVAEQFGFDGVYESLMAGRGLALVRGGTSPFLAYGGAGAIEGALLLVTSLSIYCSLKCRCK